MEKTALRRAQYDVLITRHRGVLGGIVRPGTGLTGSTLGPYIQDTSSESNWNIYSSLSPSFNFTLWNHFFSFETLLCFLLAGLLKNNCFINLLAIVSNCEDKKKQKTKHVLYYSLKIPLHNSKMKSPELSSHSCNCIYSIHLFPLLTGPSN